MMALPTKPVHTLVLDAGAIIKNEPPVSTLIKESESLVTVPAILSEIKDAAARSRVETTLRPFLTLRSPVPASVKFVTDFARRTGDLAVLSKPDVAILALTYEIECERNGGDWRLRKTPGQKGLNGAPPTRAQEGQSAEGTLQQPLAQSAQPQRDEESTTSQEPPTIPSTSFETESASQMSLHREVESSYSTQRITDRTAELMSQEQPAAGQGELKPSVNDDEEPSVGSILPEVDSAQRPSSNPGSDSGSDSDSGGWITPSNLKKRQAQDAEASTVQAAEPKTMQVAVMTSDFAMQNVLLQMNLNLLSPSLNRVKHLKTYVLRCHACFQTTKDMAKQFCPRCGQPALTRVSCSTNANGEFKVHLKKTMQWNSRGDRYSIPKPVHGSANGKIKGGGKGGWGNELILTEDQKEYQKASREEKRVKERSLMDEDYLPSILTGDRGKTGGRVKVGAGRNVNSRKRQG